MKSNNYTFILEDEDSTVTRTFNAGCISDVIEQFEYFLLGCTYAQDQIDGALYNRKEYNGN